MHRDIARAAGVLRRGGVVAFPTDTFYGLAVDPRNAAAVQRLFAVKGREAAKASPLIAASLEQARDAVVFDERAEGLAAHFWPGPLSLVLPARSPVCRDVLGGGASAAVRVPADATARDLAAALGFCVTATSANLSGHPPAQTPDEIDAAVREAVELIIDGGRAPGGAPSTIVDLTGEAPMLVRAGAIPWDRVLTFLK